MKPTRKSSLEPLDQIVSGSLARAGLRQAVKASLICHFANEIIAGKFPQKTAQFRAVSYVHSELKIRCSNHLLANQIKLSESEIIKELAEKSPDLKIRSIKFDIKSDL